MNDEEENKNDGQKTDKKDFTKTFISNLKKRKRDNLLRGLFEEQKDVEFVKLPLYFKNEPIEPYRNYDCADLRCVYHISEIIEKIGFANGKKDYQFVCKSCQKIIRIDNFFLDRSFQIIVKRFISQNDERLANGEPKIQFLVFKRNGLVEPVIPETMQENQTADNKKKELKRPFELFPQEGDFDQNEADFLRYCLKDSLAKQPLDGFKEWGFFGIKLKPQDLLLFEKERKFSLTLMGFSLRYIENEEKRLLFEKYREEIRRKNENQTLIVTNGDLSTPELNSAGFQNITRGSKAILVANSKPTVSESNRNTIENSKPTISDSNRNTIENSKPTISDSNRNTIENEISEAGSPILNFNSEKDKIITRTDPLSIVTPEYNGSVNQRRSKPNTEPFATDKDYGTSITSNIQTTEENLEQPPRNSQLSVQVSEKQKIGKTLTIGFKVMEFELHRAHRKKSFLRVEFLKGFEIMITSEDIYKFERILYVVYYQNRWILAELLLDGGSNGSSCAVFDFRKSDPPKEDRLIGEIIWKLSYDHFGISFNSSVFQTHNKLPNSRFADHGLASFMLYQYLVKGYQMGYFYVSNEDLEEKWRYLLWTFLKKIAEIDPNLIGTRMKIKKERKQKMDSKTNEIIEKATESFSSSTQLNFSEDLQNVSHLATRMSQSSTASLPQNYGQIYGFNSQNKNEPLGLTKEEIREVLTMVKEDLMNETKIISDARLAKSYFAELTEKQILQPRASFPGKDRSGQIIISKKQLKETINDFEKKVMQNIIDSEKQKFEQERKNYENYIDSINAYAYFIDLLTFYSRFDKSQYQKLLTTYSTRISAKIEEFQRQNTVLPTLEEKKLRSQIYHKLPLLDYELGRKQAPPYPDYSQNQEMLYNHPEMKANISLHQPSINETYESSKPKKELIAKRYDIEISKEDYLYFKDTLMLTEKMINLFGEYLEEKACFGPDNRSFAVLRLRFRYFPCEFYKILSRNHLMNTGDLDYDLVKASSKNINLFQDSDHLLVPIDVSKNQYILVWVNFVEKKFSYLDPVNSQYNTQRDASKNIVLRNVARFISKDYIRTFRKKFDIYSWKFANEISSEVSYYQDTGMYVCYFMYMIHKGFNSFLPTPEQVKSFAIKMMTFLMEIGFSREPIGKLDPNFAL